MARLKSDLVRLKGTVDNLNAVLVRLFWGAGQTPGATGQRLLARLYAVRV